jgi:hypothetical protein
MSNWSVHVEVLGALAVVRSLVESGELDYLCPQLQEAGPLVAISVVVRAVDAAEAKTYAQSAVSRVLQRPAAVKAAVRVI